MPCVFPGVTGKPEWPHQPVPGGAAQAPLGMSPPTVPLPGGRGLLQGQDLASLWQRSSSAAGFCQLSQRCPEHLQPHAQPSQGHLGGWVLLGLGVVLGLRVLHTQPLIQALALLL